MLLHADFANFAKPIPGPMLPTPIQNPVAINLRLSANVWTVKV